MHDPRMETSRRTLGRVNHINSMDQVEENALNTIKTKQTIGIGSLPSAGWTLINTIADMKKHN